jgi:hypothetical protein
MQHAPGRARRKTGAWKVKERPQVAAAAGRPRQCAAPKPLPVAARTAALCRQCAAVVHHQPHPRPCWLTSSFPSYSACPCGGRRHAKDQLNTAARLPRAWYVPHKRVAQQAPWSQRPHRKTIATPDRLQVQLGALNELEVILRLHSTARCVILHRGTHTHRGTEAQVSQSARTGSTVQGRATCTPAQSKARSVQRAYTTLQ